MNTPKEQLERLEEIKIDLKVPIPKKRSQRKSKYPFREMKVGDSFLVPSSITRASVSASAYSIKEFKFSIRETEEGLRCWRVK